jgi:maltose alpha-D-glucosyltransferase/alpha-amylase
MAANAEVPLGPGKLRFSSNALFAELAGAIDEDVRTPALEQSNTAVFFGNRLFLKAYRRLRDGVNPELEMGRFLTDTSPFTGIAPVVGAIEFVPDGGGEPVTLAIMQRFVENQGDLWTVTLEHLARLLTGPQQGPQADAENAAAGFHLGRMALLGRRVAELHRALAKATGDPLFDPEPVTAEDIAEWKRRALEELEAALAALDPGSSAHERLAHVMPALRQRLSALLVRPISLAKSRFHGDLHLGQVLVARDDFVIVDFEGEPARSLERRREKSCVLRDVAGMLRSFSYAAHAALTRREPGGPGTEASARALGDWEHDAARHFAEGYAKAAEGLATVPVEARAFGEPLELFLIEKAAYELRYEIAHRPEWVEIPLRGLLQMVKT